MRKVKDVTVTSLIERAMREAGAVDNENFIDFVSVRDLVRMTGKAAKDIQRALHYLRSKRVVDVVVEIDGRGWWYALPEEHDTRLRKMEERAHEEPGSRHQRKTRSDKGRRNTTPRIKS